MHSRPSSRLGPRRTSAATARSRRAGPGSPPARPRRRRPCPARRGPRPKAGAAQEGGAERGDEGAAVLAVGHRPRSLPANSASSSARPRARSRATSRAGARRVSGPAATVMSGISKVSGGGMVRREENARRAPRCRPGWRAFGSPELRFRPTRLARFRLLFLWRCALGSPLRLDAQLAHQPRPLLPLFARGGGERGAVAAAHLGAELGEARGERRIADRCATSLLGSSREPGKRAISPSRHCHI